MCQDEGFTVSLNAGQRYLIHSQYSRGLDSYELRIGFQTPTADISGSSFVGDSIYFTDQVNRYTFVPTETAAYTFRITKADSGIRLRLSVNDVGGYCLDYGYLEQNNELKVDLQAGAAYTVEIRQSRGQGAYTFQITY